MRHREGRRSRKERSWFTDELGERIAQVEETNTWVDGRKQVTEAGEREAESSGLTTWEVIFRKHWRSVLLT